MNTTQTNSTDYRTELESQRKTLQEAQKDRDAHFKEVLRLTLETMDAQAASLLLYDPANNRLVTDQASAWEETGPAGRCNAPPQVRCTSPGQRFRSTTGR